jgi:hypothetical protein
MAQTRFTCTLTTADEPACQSYAGVTITDSEGTTARGCPRHAVAALSGISGPHLDWADSRSLNEWERQALELTQERSKLSTRRQAQAHQAACPLPSSSRSGVLAASSAGFRASRTRVPSRQTGQVVQKLTSSAHRTMRLDHSSWSWECPLPWRRWQAGYGWRSNQLGGPRPSRRDFSIGKDRLRDQPQQRKSANRGQAKHR